MLDKLQFVVELPNIQVNVSATNRDDKLKFIEHPHHE